MVSYRVTGAALAAAAGLCMAGAARAQEGPGVGLVLGGKLLLTGGVSNIEGAGGGGLATWATITGYETKEGIGGNVHYTSVGLDDFDFRTYGAAVGLFDRVEVSYARQAFDTGLTGPLLTLPKDFTFKQDVYGLKVRLMGDAVYDQDRWLPQVSAGVQYKKSRNGALVKAIGAADDAGTDYYLAATKLFLNQSLLVNGTVRFTEANQTGLLGFGGNTAAGVFGPAKDDGYSTEFEGSLAYLVNRRLALGAEYRTKPDNLVFAEDGAFDVFAAFAVNRNLSVTAAYVDLGDIATFKNQRGFYVSLQAGF
jgi:hypothetical protein